MPSGIYKRTKEHKRKLSVAHKGKKFTKEHREKISISLTGRKLSKETKRKLREATKNAWKNPENHPMYGKHHTKEAKRKMSEKLCGKNHPMYGKHHLKKTKQKMSVSGIKRYENPEERKKQSERTKGKNNPMYGKTHTEEFKKLQSKKWKGKNNPNWNNGVSFEPYSEEFNYKLKELIRNRDNKICQFCGKTEKEIGRKLAVHHIDFNKKNNKPKNLIALCISCNTKANSNRNYWTEYFQGVINAYN